MNLSFLSPLFFIGLAAIALPIIAHFITRKTAALKTFPSVKFLISSKAESASRSKIKDLILLLLRSLIIVFIVLLFTKPAVFSFSARVDDRPLSLGLVIDNSFSMGFENYFEKAKDKAWNLIDSISDGSFILAAPLVNEKKTQYKILNDKNDLKKTIRDIGLSSTFTNNKSSLQNIYSELQKSPVEDRKVILITDLQKNGWTDESIDISWLQIIDISEVPYPPNHSVSDINLYFENSSLTVQSKISNFSDTPVTELLTTSELDEKEIKQFVDIKPGETANTDAKITLDSTNSASTGLVKTTKDQLIIDDTRYYVFDKENESKILVVDGDPREDSRLSEAYYLASALDTLSDNSSIRLEIVDNSGFLNEDLNGYSIIYMANVGELTPRTAQNLEEFVSNGGSVLISLGNLTRATTYNTLLKNLLPADIQTINQGEFSISAIKSETFSKDIVDKSGQITVEKLFDVIPLPDSETLIETSNNDPLLMKRNFGRGNVLLFTSTLDTAWNNFAITPIFLPVIKNLLDLPTIEKNKSRHYLVGETVKIDIKQEDSTTIVKDPSGNKYELDSQTNDFAQTNLPGIYTVLSGGEYLYNFAVNINPLESDLKKISFQLEEKDESSLNDLVKVFKEVWSYFLWGVIALFVSEAAFRSIYS